MYNILIKINENLNSNEIIMIIIRILLADE